MIEERLEFIVKRLAEAVEISNAPLVSTPEQQDQDYKNTFAYATGYSRAAMQGCVEELQELLDYIREGQVECFFGSDYEEQIDNLWQLSYPSHVATVVNC